MNEEKFTLFWNGPFSQWHRCVFIIDGVQYNCAEQYMMAMKAYLFGDQLVYDKIMKSGNPRDQKQFGRKVSNFIAHIWDEIARDVVFRGNLGKFSQNEDLKNQLFDTKGTTLVEASPYDSIWGIGLSADSPKAQKRELWQGSNWLGEVLNAVRDQLLGISESQFSVKRATFDFGSALNEQHE
jgi:ribA/ribD-fused uncharacterized protein